MAIKSGKEADVGFVKPYDVKPVPTPMPVSQPITPQQQQTKTWLDKVVDVGSKLFTGLYTGAMAGLDIYERYKMIERGQPTQTWSEVAKTTGTGQVVILGQTFDKNIIYILAGALILIIILSILRK